jgi:hypothetical protein
MGFPDSIAPSYFRWEETRPGRRERPGKPQVLQAISLPTCLCLLSPASPQIFRRHVVIE